MWFTVLETYYFKRTVLETNYNTHLFLFWTTACQHRHYLKEPTVAIGQLWSKLFFKSKSLLIGNLNIFCPKPAHPEQPQIQESNLSFAGFLLIPWFLKRFIRCIYLIKNVLVLGQLSWTPPPATEGCEGCECDCHLWFVVCVEESARVFPVQYNHCRCFSGPALEGLDKPVELFGGRHVRVDLQLEGVANRKNLQ